LPFSQISQVDAANPPANLPGGHGIQVDASIELE